MPDSARLNARRRSEADPQDRSAFLGLLAQRARSEGEEVFLECLRDRERWNEALTELQDQAIAVVGKKLGAAYRFLGAEKFSCAGLSHRLGVFEHRSTGTALHLIPGGRFMMGSPESEEDAYGIERPQHEVSLGPFLLAPCAVSQAIWDGVGGADEREFFGPELPIDTVSWNAVQAWLAKAGDGLRLPSEAEWEYACRAGSTTPFCFGDDLTMDQANFNDDPRFIGGHVPKTVAVEAFRPNAFGLFQMHGNVAEWCQDRFRDYRENPEEPSSESADSEERILRGGGFRDDIPLFLRSSGRDSCEPNEALRGAGFRLAKSLG